MKNIISVIMLGCILHCTIGIRHHYQGVRNEQTGPLVINERVGQVIEPEERQQYDLFLGVDDFESATFYDIIDEGYEVEIVTKDKRLVAVNEDPEAIEILNDYINQYEEIENSREGFEAKWHIIAYDDLGFPITEHEVNRIRCSWVDGVFGTLVFATIGGIAGFFVSLPFVLSSGGEGELEIPKAFIVSFISAILAGTIGGRLSSKASKRNALNLIKKGRRPREKE